MATSVEDPVGAAAERVRHDPMEHERFWNLPNTITVVRTGAVPLLLSLPLFPGVLGSRVIGFCFVLAALSDMLDGWLARRGKQITHIGKLLDPLADKLVISTALIVMLAMENRIPEWATFMVVIIIGRELAVTALRGIASAGGQVMAASALGKWKAATQSVAAAALIFHYPLYGLPAHTIGMVLLFAATGLTLFSGYAYFAEYFGGRRGTATPEDGR